MSFSLDNYLNKVKNNTSHKYIFNQFLTADMNAITELQGKCKKDFYDALGIDNIQFKITDLKFTILENKLDFGDYYREKICIELCENLNFPMYVLHPKKQGEKIRPLLFCHGHGIGYRSSVGLDENDNIAPPDYHKNAPIELCKLGYTIAVPEIIAFGDTKLEMDKDNSPMDESSCHMLSTNLLMLGTTLAGLRVYQAMRCVDYLLSLENVDANEMACMGISGGGMLASFLTALDDRIKSVVVSGYISSFEKSIMGMFHCVCNFVPNLYNLFEMDVLTAMIFPRTLVIEAGELDPIFPIEAVKETCEKAKKLYSTHGLEEKFYLDVFHAGHEISGKIAYEVLK